MAWEKLEKQSARRATYGLEWYKVPGVSINSMGMAFNKPFLAAFGVAAGSPIRLLIDRERRQIGVVIVRDAEESRGAHKITVASTRPSGTHYVPVKAIPKAFPDCIRRAFRARLNSDEGIIEISLDVKNELK